MSKRKFLLKSLIGFAVLALAFKALSGRSPKRKTAPKNASRGVSFEEIDDYLEAQMNRLKIPGAALAIVEGDKIVHVHGFGKTRRDGEAPAPQTPFFIGSLTKSFTALAVMQLVEAGKIKLDAPVQKYLPWFRVADPQASTQMTVRHLLNQTSGLSVASGWIPLADLDDSPDAAERHARALSKLKLTHPVGSKFEYSNTNYNLLGLIIEAASGKSYTTYIQKHIFSPLEMRHSYFTRDEAVKNGLATGHRYWFWVPVPSRMNNLPLLHGSMAAGQLISSVEDMADYLIAYANQGRYRNVRILSSAGVAEMHRPVVEAYSVGPLIGQYGMGWYNEKHGQTRVVWHSGIVPDYAAYMALIPEQKKGVILLVNVDHFMMNPVIIEVGGGIASLLAGQKPEQPKFGFVPWLMRALLLIPFLQVFDVAATLRRINNWRNDPQSRPSQGRLWGKHILLPLIPNLFLAAVPVYMLVSKMFGFIKLFAPDVSWIALICGGFAGIWSFLRTSLTLRVLRNPPRSR
jgi:CubicO group peptidase (beta-lactamase class C family)